MFKHTLTLILVLSVSVGVQASPTVYIPLGTGNQVIAVDAKTDKIIATYTDVENPHGLVVTPDGEYLIAGSLKETRAPKNDPGAKTSKLFLIHPAHGHVMSTIPVRGWTHHQAITPDGKYVLSTHAMKGDVSVYELESDKIIKRIATGRVPNYTVITRDGKKAFVTNTGNGSVAEINLETLTKTRSLKAGAAPEHMVISKDEKELYISNPRAGKVSVTSINSGKVIREFKLGPQLHGIDLGDDGKTLFVSSKKENKLYAVDSVSGKHRSISLSPSPYHLNTITGQGKVYISSSKKPIIWVVDQKSLKVIRIIKLPAGEAHQMAISGS